MARPATKAKSKPKSSRKSTKTKKEPVQLAPESQPAEPDSHGIRYVTLPSRQGGVRVTEATALTLSVVWACVKVITEDVSGLPWRVMEHRATAGSDAKPSDPADWILHNQANPETPAFEWRETMLAHALTWGNGYSEIERDGAGRVVWLWQITPDRVQVERFQGRIIYVVANPREPDTILEANDMFHLRGLGFDGLVGYSVIRMAARSLGLAIGLEQSGADLLGNDSTPGGVLTHPTKLSEQAQNNLRKTWQEKHGGPANRRRVAILEEGMKWDQTGLPPGELQFIEQRQFTPADVARWFRVTPPKIGDLTRSTYNNNEQLSIWHVTDTLTPWVRRLEGEANIKMFGNTNRGKRYTKLNLNALLRGDVESRSKYFREMLDRGVFDINEVRDLEDMNPIGSDGEKRFVQLNMQLLEKAGEEPVVKAAPPALPAKPPEKEEEKPNADDTVVEDDQQMGVLNAFSPAIAAAFKRVMNKERKMYNAAVVAKKLEGKAAQQWAASVSDGQWQYAVQELQPILDGMAGLGSLYRVGYDELRERTKSFCFDAFGPNMESRVAEYAPKEYPLSLNDWHAQLATGFMDTVVKQIFTLNK